MTALKLLSRSLRLLGVLGQGETAGGDMAADAFDDLNAMLQAWRLKRLTVFEVRRVTKTLTINVGTYTIGPGGSINVTPLPSRLSAAAIIASGQTDEHPLAVFFEQDYRTYRDKSRASTFPSDGVYLDRSFSTQTGLSNVVVLPTPSAASLTLVLYVPVPITVFADLSTTDYLLPDGWELALQLSLARYLSLSYPGTWDDTKEAAAVDALAMIQRINEIPEVLSVDRALIGHPGGGYDIHTGE